MVGTSLLVLGAHHFAFKSMAALCVPSSAEILLIPQPFFCVSGLQCIMKWVRRASSGRPRCLFTSSFIFIFNYIMHICLILDISPQLGATVRHFSTSGMPFFFHVPIFVRDISYLCLLFAEELFVSRFYPTILIPSNFLNIC